LSFRTSRGSRDSVCSPSVSYCIGQLLLHDLPDAFFGHDGLQVVVLEVSGPVLQALLVVLSRILLDFVLELLCDP